MKRIVFILVALAALVLVAIALVQSAQPPAVSADIVGLRSTDSTAGSRARRLFYSSVCGYGTQ